MHSNVKSLKMLHSNSHFNSTSDIYFIFAEIDTRMTVIDIENLVEIKIIGGIIVKEVKDEGEKKSGKLSHLDPKDMMMICQISIHH